MAIFLAGETQHWHIITFEVDMANCQQAVAYLHIQKLWSKQQHSFGIVFRATWWMQAQHSLSFNSVLVSTNSWGKYLAFQLRICASRKAPLCSPACHGLCLSAVWCWAGCVQWVYGDFFPENCCPLRTNMMQMRAVRLNKNSKVAGQKSKTMSWKLLICTVELRRNCKVGW